jgi:tetratricopeptide (TPR) repeat protein
MTNYEALGVEIEKALLAEVDDLVKQAHAKKKEPELLDEIAAHRKKCTEGFGFCLDAIAELAELEPEINLEQLKNNLASSFQKLNSMSALGNQGRQSLEGNSISAVLGFSEETLEWLYKGAKHLFEEERYHEAENAFLFITTFDQKNYAFWLGLGHASFHCNNFTNALKAYAMAQALDPSSVWPHVYAANAFEAIQNYHHALVALELADKTSKHSKKERNFDEALKQRIGIVKQKMRKG